MNVLLFAEVSPVTLQLDLGNLFQLDNLVLNFKVRHSLLPEEISTHMVVLFSYSTSFFAGSSSRCFCHREDTGQRADMAACSLLVYRLSKNVSRRPHDNASFHG